MESHEAGFPPFPHSHGRDVYVLSCSRDGVAGRNEFVTNVWSAAGLQGKSLVEKTSLRKCIRPLGGE
jgi:hypothetical protein